jgi:hypothetical protein
MYGFGHAEQAAGKILAEERSPPRPITKRPSPRRDAVLHSRQIVRSRFGSFVRAIVE